MGEQWTADHVPVEAYDRLSAQLDKAERLLTAIATGKHSIPGSLTQIERYFVDRGQPLRALKHTLAEPED